MNLFARIAEERIRRAIDRGELDDLPGRGRPLDLEEDAFVPEDLRMAYRVLRNAEMLPPELELEKEILTLSRLYEGIDEEEERRRALRELDFRLLQLRQMRGGSVAFDRMARYEARLYARRLERSSGNGRTGR